MKHIVRPVIAVLLLALALSCARQPTSVAPSGTAAVPSPVIASPSAEGGTTTGPRTAPPATTQAPSPHAQTRLLENKEVGYSLLYPADWMIAAQVIATEFALDAECQSVQIIDFQPPQGSGARILYSFVQICARPLEDALTLEQFMILTYGNLLGEQFEPVMFGGRSAYPTRNAGSDTTTFLHTQNHRVQIVSAVAAEPDVFPIRAAQVEAILASLTFAG